jgi:predicted dehydrogenase
VTAPDAPVILEAFHYRFHPAWQKFLSLIHDDPLAGPVVKASVYQYAPKGFVPQTGFRFQYELAGGCLIDYGTYNISSLRQILNDDRPEVVSASYRGVPLPKLKDQQPEPQIDQAITATYKSASGATGEMVADLVSTGGFPPFLPKSWTKDWPSCGWPKCVVELGEKEIPTHEGNATEGGTDRETHTIQRTLTMWNFVMATLYHRIDVHDTHRIRRGEQSLRTWTETKKIKAYTYDWPKREQDQTSSTSAGADWWMSYRYQLEEFVNHVKGRATAGSGVWVHGADSIAQMEVIDRTYEKAGLKARPTSEFAL